MMKRPSLARDKRSEKKSSSGEKDELNKALDEAVDRSVRTISEKIGRLVKEKAAAHIN